MNRWTKVDGVHLPSAETDPKPEPTNALTSANRNQISPFVHSPGGQRPPLSTFPEVNHARWCRRPELRRSADMFNRAAVRYRCPECGRQIVILNGQPPLPDPESTS